jgi:hypothetical protein
MLYECYYFCIKEFSKKINFIYDLNCWIRYKYKIMTDFTGVSINIVGKDYFQSKKVKDILLDELKCSTWNERSVL